MPENLPVCRIRPLDDEQILANLRKLPYYRTVTGMAQPVIPDEGRLCCSCDELAFFRAAEALAIPKPQGTPAMPAHDSPDKKTAAETTVSEETLLKMSKEIAVKFIEVGRITPANFPEIFKGIHTAIKDSISKDKS